MRKLVETPLAVKAVVIDLDGTLLHTAPDIAEAVNLTLAEMQLPVLDSGTVKSYIGNGVGQLLKRVLTGKMDGEPAAEEFARASAIFHRHYENVCCRSQPFPDVMAGLQALKQAGYRLGCITNKSEKFTLPLLKTAGMWEYFELVLSGDSLPRKKPDPMPLLHACEKFGIAPDQLLLIGDSVNDTQAARAAGCHVFCVPYGYNREGPVSELDVDAVVNGLLDATTLIRKA